jgi:hypothetical protein
MNLAVLAIDLLFADDFSAASHFQTMLDTSPFQPLLPADLGAKKGLKDIDHSVGLVG